MTYKVIDGLFSAELITQADAEWPSAAASWVRYDTPEQRKRTLGCRRGPDGEVRSDWPHIPPACRELLGRMLALDVAGLLNIPDRLVPDTLLWGAGLHEMRRGDILGWHLDADRHSLLGLERRANAILFVSEWDAAWGGAMEVAGAPPVFPAPGRLVVFETNDASWHGVPAPLACPEGAARRSLAVYWWGQPRGGAKRPRARFASRGE